MGESATSESAASAPSGVLARHQAALSEGRFLIQRCQDCARHIYFPRELCPHCGSVAVSLVAPSGLGTVYSTSVVRRKPADGGDYNVALIDLDEGVRLMSKVEQLAPDAVTIGLRVRARVEQREAGNRVVFDPVQAG